MAASLSHIPIQESQNSFPCRADSLLAVRFSPSHPSPLPGKTKAGAPKRKYFKAGNSEQWSLRGGVCAKDELLFAWANESRRAGRWIDPEVLPAPSPARALCYETAQPGWGPGQNCQFYFRAFNNVAESIQLTSANC
jgi:hypothetical protein